MGSLISNPNTAQGGPSGFYNPSGVFGAGNVRFFTANGTFSVPAGVYSVRARAFGAGGDSGGATPGGGGGGFALKTCEVVPGQAVPVTVGAVGGASSSFGSFCSATGGASGSVGAGASGGAGAGGDINNSGGSGGLAAAGSGGGVGNYFGRGGVTSGAGRSGTTAAPALKGTCGMGWDGRTGLDFIGTGPGGSYDSPAGRNGGGGGYEAAGGFPGGGGGGGGGNAGAMGCGLVVVEW